MRILEISGSPSAAHCRRILVAAGADATTVYSSTPHDRVGALAAGAFAIIRPCWYRPSPTTAIDVSGHPEETRPAPRLPGAVHDPLPWRSFLHGTAMAVEVLAREQGAAPATVAALRRTLADGTLYPQPGTPTGPVEGSRARLHEAADGWLVAGSSLLPGDVLAALLDGDPPGSGDPHERLARWVGGQTRLGAATHLQRLRAQATPVNDSPEAIEHSRAESIGAEPSVGGRPLASRPLAGMTVLDLTHLWAGPLCAQVLRLLGAEVIKVEGPRHPDRLRFWRAGPGLPSFAALNHGKRGLAVDLGCPDGRRALIQMLAAVDGVVDNYSPRALANWGLNPKSLATRHGITWVSIPAFTAAGPWATWGSRGAGIEASSGLAWVQGTAGRPSLMEKPMTDPVAGLRAACAFLVARRTQRGTHVEVSQNSVASELSAELAARAIPGLGRFADLNSPAATCAPALGEHSAEVLSELGVSASTTRTMFGAGTVIQPNQRLASEGLPPSTKGTYGEPDWQALQV